MRRRGGALLIETLMEEGGERLERLLPAIELLFKLMLSFSPRFDVMLQRNDKTKKGERGKVSRYVAISYRSQDE